MQTVGEESAVYVLCSGVAAFYYRPDEGSMFLTLVMTNSKTICAAIQVHIVMRNVGRNFTTNELGTLQFPNENLFDRRRHARLDHCQGNIFISRSII
ncbi:hypothetical protein [uncultured Brevibacillus sp.]|uniref:hypothetical protein n=1 Tax=uncultured Brevibacillus sp. TaxID=169970 RepID=UPI0025972787|nr:hypothetical protein [uncultured Brevibacillus sp.]